MNQRKLDRILHAHKGWLMDKKWGVRADFRWSDLCGSDLSGSDLRGADFRWAKFRGADFCGTDLRQSNLYGAKGIISAGPIGEIGRYIYTVDQGDKIMVKLGCFWGTKKEAKKAIEEKYGKKSTYWAVVKACCKELESRRWRNG